MTPESWKNFLRKENNYFSGRRLTKEGRPEEYFFIDYTVFTYRKCFSLQDLVIHLCPEDSDSESVSEMKITMLDTQFYSTVGFSSWQPLL